MRVSPQRPGQVTQAPRDRCVVTRPAALGDPRDIDLGLVHPQLATLRLDKAHVACESPRIRPVAGLGAMDQRMAQRVPPRVSLPGRWPRCVPSRQRSMMRAERVVSDGLCDVSADRVVVQPVLELPSRPLGLDEQLLRRAHPRPALRVAAPVSHRADLVERERLASGTQDPEARHDRRIRRDARPRLLDQRGEAPRDVLHATLFARQDRQPLSQLHGVLHVAARAGYGLVDKACIEVERLALAAPLDGSSFGGGVDPRVRHAAAG
jgi:hypothetical protein